MFGSCIFIIVTSFSWIDLCHYVMSFSISCYSLLLRQLFLIEVLLPQLSLHFLLKGIPFSILWLFCLLVYNLFLFALGLHCCTWAFSSCSKQDLLFTAVHGLLIVVASHLLQSTGSWHTGLSSRGVWALELRLKSCEPLAYLFLDMWSPPGPRIKPCPLPRQAGAYPLYHQGSPILSLLACASLDLKWASCRQHIYGSFPFNPFSHSASFDWSIESIYI